eukprot:CAMPEP_0119056950 /NCGR_PEP_ID=MMETSP1178-20130426/1508_1 /TAXON_ID=33656 /ORGANISM="unid sp, Strain CCMP2000" /LENGTH=233 /DNA_ID=CAMNT_0007037733 /DNA_START=97 /DNA_END=798 /DNA_ORIENTATION=+
MTLKTDEEAGGGELPLIHQVHVLSDGRRLGLVIGTDRIGSALGPRGTLAFLATNLPYMVVAVAIWWTGPAVPDRSPACLGERCSSGTFHAAMVTCMAAVSLYWHGAQCQLGRRADGKSVSLLGRLYCRRTDGTIALHSQSWLRWLVVCDILCSLGLVGIGLCCFGPLRTLTWISPAFAAFAMGSRAKQRREWRTYAFFHGLWHCLSAISISQIVLNAKPLFGSGMLHWVESQA